MKMHRRVRGKGFTLVELLVVIAIIGILVAIVLPAVNNALFRGRLTATTVNGTNLIKSIIARDTEVLYRSAASGWPRQGGTTIAESNIFANSTDFLKHMVTAEVMNVTYSFFAAPGVPSANDAAQFTADRNAWAIVSWVGDAYPETAPVLFTRNLFMNAMNDGLTADTTRRDVVAELAPGAQALAQQPFGSRGLSVVTKGGAGFSLYRDDLQLQFFTNVFVRVNAQGVLLTNVVLRP